MGKKKYEKERELYMGERRIENVERNKIKWRKWKARNYKEREVDKEERCEKTEKEGKENAKKKKI